MNEQFERLMTRVESLMTRIESALPQALSAPDWTASVAFRYRKRSTGHGVLWCDGRRRTELPAGSVVEVRRSPQPVRLARLDEAVFTDRLVNKFHLPVSGWRGTRATQPAPLVAEGEGA